MHSPQVPRQILQVPETGEVIGRVAERYPVNYSPRSATRVNTPRLPVPDAMQGMELAFREETQNEEALCKTAQIQVVLFAVFGSLGAFVVHLIGPVVSFFLAFTLSLIIAGLAAAAFIFFPAKRNIRVIAASFVLPPLVVVASYFLSLFLSIRPLASFVLGMISLFFMYLIGAESHPLHFYWEWCHAAPHLKPETRRKRWSARTRDAVSLITWSASSIFSLVLNLLIPVSVLAIIVFVAAYSPSVAILSLLAVGIVFNDFNPWGTFKLARRVLAHYLTYGSRPSGAPGVWSPGSTLGERRWASAVTVFVFYLALSTGLCLYFPSDLFAIESQAGIAHPVEKNRSTETLSTEIRKYFTRDRSALEMVLSRNTDTHLGLNTALQAWWKTFQVTPGNVFLFLILPFGLSVFLPNLLILAMFRNLLVRYETHRQKIEGGKEDFINAGMRRAALFIRNIYRWIRKQERLERTEIWVPGIDDDGRTEWQWYVDRIRKSPHETIDPLGNVVREADHLFLGVEPTLQFPILLDRKIVSEHVYIAGQTGSGKTSLGIMPLLIQLIRGSAPGGKQSAPVPIVIIDLKGDPALFHTVRAEARAKRQDFRFFTPEKGKVSHFFNPFYGFQSESRTFIQLCNLFLDSLSLNHGEGYGRSYYSRRSRQALFDALNHPSKPQTFEELKDVMAKMMQKEEYKDAYEVFSTIFALAEYPALITTAEQEKNAPETTINMQTAIENKQIVYFWLPSAIESITAKEIGKLALFCLLSAAIDRQLSHPEEDPQQVYLVIDEFQRLAGENFKIVLEQARSFGVSAILANQTLSDLKTKDIDLRPTILTNTRAQFFFTVKDPLEVKALSQLSGEEIRISKSWGKTENLTRFLSRRHTKQESYSEGFKERLTTNDILGVSDHPLEVIVSISRGSGYTQFGGLPFPVRTIWPMDAGTYRRIGKLRWPKKEDYPAGDVVENRRSPKEIEIESRIELLKEKQARMKEVLGEIEK